MKDRREEVKERQRGKRLNNFKVYYKSNELMGVGKSKNPHNTITNMLVLHKLSYFESFLINSSVR